MMVGNNVEDWGTTKAGFPVKKITLKSGALSASIITYGAAIQDLRIEGHGSPLVLGFDSLESYENHKHFFGSTVGRYANRVSGGVCTINGTEYQLDLGEGDVHHLHGGPEGFFAKCWEIAEVSEHSVTLKLLSKDGEAGYPGNLEVQCIYSLNDDNILSIDMRAQTDAPTICNLANHSYFNLEDGGLNDVSLHRLRLDAEQYLVSDETNAPTGEIADVSQTLFDFRTLRPIGDFTKYDHNFCLSNARRPLTEVARLVAQSSGVEMDMLTTEPGIQFYGGAYIELSETGLGGLAYKTGSGLCLETQIWPDAINFDTFPEAVLMPGDVLQQHTLYRFSKIDT